MGPPRSKNFVRPSGNDEVQIYLRRAFWRCAYTAQELGSDFRTFAVSLDDFFVDRAALERWRSPSRMPDAHNLT